MTDDAPLPFDLPSVRSKKLTIDFAGGNQSSNGGVPLLLEAGRAGSHPKATAMAGLGRRDSNLEMAESKSLDHSSRRRLLMSSVKLWLALGLVARLLPWVISGSMWWSKALPRKGRSPGALSRVLNATLDRPLRRRLRAKRERASRRMWQRIELPKSILVIAM
jgi:hypothetical protein